MDDTVRDHFSFTTNRDRLSEHNAVRKLFGQIVAQAGQSGLRVDCPPRGASIKALEDARAPDAAEQRRGVGGILDQRPH